MAFTVSIDPESPGMFEVRDIQPVTVGGVTIELPRTISIGTVGGQGDIIATPPISGNRVPTGAQPIPTGASQTGFGGPSMGLMLVLVAFVFLLALKR